MSKLTKFSFYAVAMGLIMPIRIVDEEKDIPSAFNGCMLIVKQVYRLAVVVRQLPAFLLAGIL